MLKQTIATLFSPHRASLCSLALTLGVIAGCGPVIDDTPTGQAPEVGSVQQRVDEIFNEPFGWPELAKFNSVPSCTFAESLPFYEDTDEEHEVTCSLTLPTYKNIRRPLLFTANSSGVVLDCQDPERARLGGSVAISRWGREFEMIRIRSEQDVVGGDLVKDDQGYYMGRRPESIIIRDCTIEGATRIKGIQTRTHVNKSSHDPQGLLGDGKPTHVARARAIAPTNIVFERVTMIAKKATPLYVHDGANRITVVDSTITGDAGAKPGIYFDQESTEITILNSKVSVKSEKDWPSNGREQFAMDATSYDFLVGNRVAQLDDGGSNLYRNCGEHSTIRYSTPSYNVIFGNQYVYKKFHQPILDDRKRYAVHLSSRNGGKDYCSDDKYRTWLPPILDAEGNIVSYQADTDFPAGPDTSFSTVKDNAHDNIVTGNEFLNRAPKNYMKNSSGLFNFTAGNREVREFSSGKKACFSPQSFGRVLNHGNTETVDWFINGDPACAHLTCDDGVLDIVEDISCPSRSDPIHFDCRTTDDNNGCQNFLSCPVGQKVKWAKAACNLETGPVTDDQLASVPPGNLKVVRRSDNLADGGCYVLGAALADGMVGVTPNPGVRTVNIACKEKDKNGGDCHVRAEFACE